MRYVMIFLAVLVVLLLMIGFMFLVIRQVSDRVTGQVNGRYMRELSVFDRLYEEKKKLCGLCLTQLLRAVRAM